MKPLRFIYSALSNILSMLTILTQIVKISAASFSSSRGGYDGAIRMFLSSGSLPYG